MSECFNYWFENFYIKFCTVPLCFRANDDGGLLQLVVSVHNIVTEAKDGEPVSLPMDVANEVVAEEIGKLIYNASERETLDLMNDRFKIIGMTDIRLSVKTVCPCSYGYMH